MEEEEGVPLRIPFILSPWKGIGSGDLFISVTVLAIHTFQAGEVAGVITRG